MKHLQEAKKMEEYYRLEAEPEEEPQVLKWIFAHALIAIAEELKTANVLKRIELENVEGFKVKMKDLPLWFRNKE